MIFLAKHPQVDRFIRKRIKDGRWFVIYDDINAIIFVRWNNENSHLMRNEILRKRNARIATEGFMKNTRFLD